MSNTPASADSRYCLLSVVTIAAVVPAVLLMAPAIVGALINGLGLSPQHAGYLVSIELGGMALATLPALLWLPRWDWRVAMRGALLLAAAADLLSCLADSFPLLAAARFLAAIGQGSAMILCMTVIGLSSRPDANYGWWTVGQLVFGAVGLAAAPLLLPITGMAGLYALLAGLLLLLVPTARFLPAGGPPAPVGKSPLPLAGLAGLAAIFIFYVAISGVWTFAERIADSAGFDAVRTGAVLAQASIVGIFGALTATLLGTRIGRLAPIVSGLGLSVAGIWLMHSPGALPAFALACYAFKFAWTFVLPYLLAVIAALDPGGRLMALVNLTIGGGLAAGPALIAAGLGSPPDYGIVSTLGIAATIAGGILILPGAILAGLQRLPVVENT